MADTPPATVEQEWAERVDRAYDEWLKSADPLKLFATSHGFARSAWYDAHCIMRSETPSRITRLRGPAMALVWSPDGSYARDECVPVSVVRESDLVALERRCAAVTEKASGFDLVAHLHRQRAFSESTFGPGRRTEGVLAHIRKELTEIEADPLDVLEWIDVVLLALDGAWRAGFQPEEIAAALNHKQAKNEARRWPDWRTAPGNGPIEHERTP